MENNGKTFQENGEKLIERKIYNDAYEYLKDSFFSCIDTQSPKMFVVVGPGGRGKTKRRL